MKLKKDGKVEESAKVLFGEAILDLSDDGFEGSSDENCIFMEVLYGNDTGGFSERCNIESALKSKGSAENFLPCEDAAVEKFCPKHESFGLVVTKCRRLLFEPHVHEIRESSYWLSEAGKDVFQPKALEEVSSDGCPSDIVCHAETLTFHVVEYCNLGINTSNYDLLKQQEAHVHNVDFEQVVSRYAAGSPLRKHVEEANISEAIMRSAFEKCCVPNGAVSSLGIPVGSKTFEEKFNDYNLLESGQGDVNSIPVTWRHSKERNHSYETDGWNKNNAARPLRSLGEEVSLLKGATQPVSQEIPVTESLKDIVEKASEQPYVVPTVAKEGCQEVDCIKSAITNMTLGSVQHSRQEEGILNHGADNGKTSTSKEVADQLADYVQGVDLSNIIMPSISKDDFLPKFPPGRSVTSVEELPVASTSVNQTFGESNYSNPGITNVTSGFLPLRWHGEITEGYAKDPDERDVEKKYVKDTSVSKVSLTSSCAEMAISMISSNTAVTSVQEPICPIIDEEESPVICPLKSDVANVTSGFVLHGYYDEVDSMDDEDNWNASNKTEMGSPPGQCVTEASRSKATTPLVYQESSVCTTSAVEDFPVLPFVAKQISEDSSLLKFGNACATSMGDSNMVFHASNETKKENSLEKSSEEDKAPKAILSPVSTGSSEFQLLPLCAGLTIQRNSSQEPNLFGLSMADFSSRKHLKRNCRSIFRQQIGSVQSSSQGALSGCALLNQFGQKDIADEGNFVEALNEIEMDQESSVSKLVPAASVTGFGGNCSSLTVIDEEPREGNPFGMGIVDHVLTEDSIKSLRPRLREHINLVLTAAGWEVVIRERKYRPSYYDTLFASPMAKHVCKLPKAWRSCGESLFGVKINSIRKDFLHEWVDVSGFWNDLSITLAYIETEMQKKITQTSLAECWRLLDPFVTVVCIDRRIDALRSGNAVKFVDGVSFVLKNETDLFEGLKRKYRRKNQVIPLSGGEVGKLNGDLVPAIEAGNTVSQMGCHCVTPSFAEHREQNLSTGFSKSELLLDEASMMMAVSEFSPSESMQMNASLAQESSVLCLEQSRCQDLKSREGAYINKTVDCKEVGEMAPLESNVGLGIDKSPVQEVKQQLKENIASSGHSEQFEPSTDGEHMLSWCSPEKVCHGMRKTCEAEVHDLGQSSIHPESQSSTFHSYPNSERVKLSHNHEDLDGNAFEVSNFEMEVASTTFDEIGSIGETQKKPERKRNVHARKKLKRVSQVKAIKSERECKMIGLAPPQGIESQWSNFSNLDRGREGIALADLRKGRKLFSSMVASLHNGRLLLIDQHSEESLVEQQISSIYSHENACHRGHTVCQDDLLAYKKALQAKTSCSVDVKIDGATNDAEHRAGYAKKRSKKSRKISEIKATKLYGDRNVAFMNFNESSEDVITDRAVRRQKLLMDNTKKGISSSQHQYMEKPISHNKNGSKRSRACLIDDDQLLIAAIIQTKDFGCSGKLKAARNLKSRKGNRKLVVRNSGKGGKMDGKLSIGTRTTLSWLLDAGVLSLNEVIQYRNPKDGTVVKDAKVTWDGLFCTCCNSLLSVSQFKVHAGFKLNRPCSTLFLESGKPFTLCQLQAWSSEYKARKVIQRQVVNDASDQNDDTCGICGDGGELICCDSCPSTFHQSCLFIQELPEGSWYCTNCTCKICGIVANDKEASSSVVILQCSQCEYKYHGTCVGINCGQREIDSDPWFCGGNCQEVYSGLRSRIGVQNQIEDDFSWTLLRCIYGDQKIHSAQRFALMAECNTKLAIGLTIMEECFLPMVDPRTGIDMIPHVMYNWGSEFARLNYQGFYTAVLEKGDELISVASIRVHGAAVAEMPLIATCSEHRRQGMCRHLMNAVEEMLISFKVQMLVISAIPHLVDTWTSGFGFIPISGEDREKLNSVNLMIFPGTTMLKKSLHRVESLETKQSGLENDLSQRKHIPKEDGLSTSSSLVPESYLAEKSCVGFMENYGLQNCKNLQAEEHSDCQLKISNGACSREAISETVTVCESENNNGTSRFSVREEDTMHLALNQSVCNAVPVAASSVSANLAKEKAQGGYNGDQVLGIVDSDNACYCTDASHNDEKMDMDSSTEHLKPGESESTQLQYTSTVVESSENMNSAHVSTGAILSAENVLDVAFINKLNCAQQEIASLSQRNSDGSYSQNPFLTTPTVYESKDINDVDDRRAGVEDSYHVALIKSFENEVPVANALSSPSFNSAKEVLGVSMSRTVAEACSGKGLQFRAADANNVCHSADTGFEDEKDLNIQDLKLANGEYTYLPLPTLELSSKNEDSLHVSAGVTFSADKGFDVASTKKPLENGKIDAPKSEELGEAFPRGICAEAMDVVTSASETVATIASCSVKVDADDVSKNCRSIPRGFKTHSGNRILSYLTKDINGQNYNADSLDRKEQYLEVGLESVECPSPGFMKENGGVGEIKVAPSVDSGAEKGNDSRNECCFISSTTLVSKALVQP